MMHLSPLEMYLAWSGLGEVTLQHSAKKIQKESLTSIFHSSLTLRELSQEKTLKSTQAQGTLPTILP